jgi:hypothetical protein
MTQNETPNLPPKNGKTDRESSPDDSGKNGGDRPPQGVTARFLNWLIRGAERSRRDRGRCPT